MSARLPETAREPMGSAAASAMLVAQGLRKEVSSPEGPLTILDDVSLAVSVGESVAIAAPARARSAGFVFQSCHLLPALTALEQVMLPLELKGHRGARERARAALDAVGLLPRAGPYPRQLSGGEQQRVAIARAFVGEPALLFADEPSGNLDTATGERVADLLFTMNRKSRTTLVLVTHEQGLARRCD